MNPLLKRQIRKFLPEEFHSDIRFEKFLDAIDRSYSTSEEQFGMLQRATTISSQELFNANQQLLEETEAQKNIIAKLRSVIDKLKFYDLDTDLPIESNDSLKLVDFIDNQTKEIIKINQQKDLLVKNLERQNQELNDYAHMVSHDIKTPLQSVDALTTWILEDYSRVLDHQGKETLKLIKENVEKMDTLLKGILQYSTIGKIEKDLYDVNLNSLVNDIIRDLNLKENISFIIPNKLPIIKADRYRLDKLFLHLINNAITYNDKEKITIEIGFKEGKDFWNFYVKDNGNGIEKRFFNKIFIAFQKLEDDYKSAGIGLSIVKKIIEVYNGEIYVESEPNVGSTFYFSIKK
ncbi:sensor histidine kinase [Polaribacter septentrionalilitoris]|uniref:sensor histidine kinase n=1 Tax=Polaribacter septentrionalilitoris TaxID=2494657 RepID=UPI00135B8D15|nr:ATP-binding protein [Polaribacter septentrionalilitoris]